MMSTPMAITLITVLMATWWVLHKLAHVIVTEYGITGGLVVCGAIYASSLVMDHYNYECRGDAFGKAKKFLLPR